MRLAAALACAALAAAADDPWAALAPTGVDLVYAAAAPAGTAGMFGHIMLVVRGAGGEVAVAYAARIGDDGPLELAWKGLGGGYDAGLDIDAWAPVLAEYQRTDQRPVWAYPLALDEAARRRLLDAIAARQGRAETYHLLTGNCAAGVADLLDAASPGAAIRQRAGACAMPGEIVRAAHDAGLIGSGRRLPGPGADGRDPLDDPPAGRLDAGWGVDRDGGFASLALRPAWRGRDDMPGSAPLGDALTVLAAELRWHAGAGRIAVQRAELIAVDALARRPDRPYGPAWQAAAGLQRERTGADGDGDTQAGIQGGWGGSWSPAAPVLAWALAAADLRLADDATRPAAGAGLAAGAAADLGPLHAGVRLRALRWVGQDGPWERRAEAAATWRLTRRLALGLDGALGDAWGCRSGEAAARIQVHF